MNDELHRASKSLHEWCREHDFAGHDPFDALNSRLFQSTPLKHARIARLAWTQLFKRSPVNLRSFARVPAGKNAKGTALFALAAVAEFRRTRTKEAEREARALLDDLLAAQLVSRSGAACWGYNFDWQGRAFFAPQGTPTIVPTAFAARALVEASTTFEDESYLKIAHSACEFIISDLPRSEETSDEICWSYSPLDKTRVFNASLLAAETLASVGTLANEVEFCSLALKGARYVVRRARADGSWAYGADSFQSWADNFHTAFVLTSLARIMNACATARVEFEAMTKRGYEFWRDSFFLADGWPKYFHDRLYPADAHAAGAALVALTELQSFDTGALALAEKIALWATRNLRDPRGFFYYQRRRLHTIRTPYMRWSQSWMLYGLARLLEQGERRETMGESEVKSAL